MVEMTTEQVLTLIRLAVQESNRHPVMACTDAGGLPQIDVLPFAHLNRNLSLVLLMPEENAAQAVVREQHWVEIQFHTENHHCFVRFGGRVFNSQVDTAAALLADGYPFLKPWLTGVNASQIALVQMHTQIIGVELFQSDSLWYKPAHYRVQNGVPVPITAADIGEVQAQGAGQLDTIRRIITHNRGQMIHSIIVNDFDGFSSNISADYEAPEGHSTEDWVNAQWKLYKSIDPARMTFTWGVNGFELKRDGTVECRFFLEISEGGKKRIIQHQENWMLESASWKLIRVV